MMASRWWWAGIAALASAPSAVGNELLVSKNSETSPIPSWKLQSSSKLGDDLAPLSKPGADTSSWHDIPISKCTVMACLLQIGMYKDEELWFSDNLRDFNNTPFRVPWVYRNEFALSSGNGKHFLLETNGITSRADIYLNGQLVADSAAQSGSYAGHEYDITSLAADDNALVIQAHPTDYYHDLAIDFLDWNPPPPDNGTGVWRDVNIRQTGSVSLGPIRAVVDMESVSLRATAKNLEDKEVKFTAEANITEPANGKTYHLTNMFTLAPRETTTVEFNKTFDNPKVWWPMQWGDQPLYSASMATYKNDELSDSADVNFGLRTVTSEVNDDDDRIFTVNGHRFQVIGSGYSAEMFMRWDAERFETIVKYVLDMGLNTIRLEGKMEQPELYQIADQYGLMVMAGWECCDKWESWKYNEDLPLDPPDYWDAADYADAQASMQHESLAMQHHPSMLAFLVGSDYWPNDQATKIYMDVMKNSDWQVPIVASASKRGFPKTLGHSGMKMEGPYDWVPPNYWYDTTPGDKRYGAAFGFGSELGSGVGTPEMGSLKRFLTKKDMDDLWKKPNKGLYHMSTNVSSFFDREIYNKGLYERYGKPKSLDDYLRKAQIMDYEAIRSQHESFSSLWSTGRIATGMIYWMLNNAWPSLHWNQFDYYLHPAGSYFGSKVGARVEHVAYDYKDKSVWLINHSIDRTGSRKVDVEVVDLKGKSIAKTTMDAKTTPNKAVKLDSVSGLNKADDVVFLRLILRDNKGKPLSRNVYWVAPAVDKLDWANSTWYTTPVTDFADYTSLFDMDRASVKASSTSVKGGSGKSTIILENKSAVPAFFIRLNLVDQDGQDVNPVMWSDNYVTLWPKEKLQLTVDGMGAQGAAVHFDGVNVAASKISL